MSASIVIDDGTNPPVIGSVVQAFAFLGVSHTLSNFDNTGVAAWRWTLLDQPIGGGAVLTTPLVSTTPIVPDVPGTYLLRLRTYTDAAAAILDDEDMVVLSVLFDGQFDWRVPAAGETLEADATRGWATAREEAIRATQAYLNGGLATAFAQQNTIEMDGVPLILQQAATTVFSVDSAGHLTAAEASIVRDEVTSDPGLEVTLTNANSATPIASFSGDHPDGFVQIITADGTLYISGSRISGEQDITIRPSDPGSSVTLAAADGSSGIGGDVVISAGAGDSFEKGGDLTISAGGGGDGAGAGLGPRGGTLELRSGDEGADIGLGLGVSGDLIAGVPYLGPPSSVNGDQGCVFIYAGAALPLTTPGSVQIDSSNDVWTNADNDFSVTALNQLSLYAGKTSADAIVLDAYDAAGGISLHTQSTERVAISSTGVGVGPVGSASAPAISNLTHTQTGIWWPDASGVGIATQGAEVARFRGVLNDAAGDEAVLELTTTVNKASGNYTLIKGNVTETAAPGSSDYLIDLRVGGASQFVVDNLGRVNADSGSAAGPGYKFLADGNSGYFLVSNDITAISGGGLEIVRFSAPLGVTPQILGAPSSAAAPVYSFESDPNTGIYRAAENILGFATSGVNRLSIGTSSADFSVVLRAPAGTAAVPSVSLTSATTSGLYGFSATQLGIAANGVHVVRVFDGGVDITGDLESDNATINTDLIVGGSITVPDTVKFILSAISGSVDGETSMFLAYYDGVTTRYEAVVLGADDSGGSGLRALCVPN